MQKLAIMLLALIIVVTVLCLSTACGSDSGDDVTSSIPPISRDAVPEPAIEISASLASSEKEGLVPQSLVTERMIVQTGNLNLKVTNVAQTMNTIKEIAQSSGGYVDSSKWNNDERQNSATISIRVPAEKYDSAIELLRKLALEILHESTQVQDVTEEYTDLAAQLRNLEATESRYLDLLEKAETVEEMLEIEQMISKTRGNIEQIKGRMQYLEHTSATSFIEIDLIEESELIADFTTNSIEVRQDTEVWFINETTGGSAPYGFHWDFGDGSIDTDRDPRPHDYTKAGKYTISLIVTDSKGNTNTQTKVDYITVVTKPGWSAGDIVQSAWHGLIDIGHFLVHIGIWLTVFSVIWVPATLFVFLFKHYRRSLS